MNKDLRCISGLLEGLWTMLQPSCLLTLATARPEGGAAARMVVLREADRTSGTVTIYTHLRSDKVSQLTHDPQAELLFWDRECAFQARMSAHVEITQGRSDLWETLSHGARLNYASFPVPGADITDPIAASVPNADLFTVLKAHIHRLDLLHIGALPHVRAIYDRADDFTGRWVAP